MPRPPPAVLYTRFRQVESNQSRPAPVWLATVAVMDGQKNVFMGEATHEVRATAQMLARRVAIIRSQGYALVEPPP